MASSSLLRLINRKVFVGSFNKCIRSSSFSYSSLFNSGNNDWFNRRMSTMSSSVNLNTSSISTKSSSSPWLMLPPEASDLKFYSLAENKVVNISVEKEISDLFPNLDFKGSSLGWLALYNPYNLDLFLYNPISRRRINLPPVRTLPNIPDENLEGGYGCVGKVILSCSPDDPEQDCRVMITYNTYSALAFCCPGKSTKWTPIGEIYGWDDRREWKYARSYSDFVYSNTQQVFLCLTGHMELETWDLRDPSSPRMKMTPIHEAENESDKDCSDSNTPRTFVPETHLVLVESELLVVDQHVMEQMAPDGSYVEFDGFVRHPHKTIDFEVFKYDPEEWDFKKMDGSSLDGLALFMGFYTHSMALSTSEFPELKPNSIYFTDPYSTPSRTVDEDDDESCNGHFRFKGHDIGIFNYQDKTISPCYYPCDVRSFKKIVPAPMWFFPSPI